MDEYDEEFLEEEEEYEGGSQATSPTCPGPNCSCEPSLPKGKLYDVNARNRLPLRIKSNLEKLRFSIPYPPEAVPKTHLPHWPELPLQTKLPNVPAPPGAIIFSRGRIAKSLIRRRKNFTTRDPWHMQRIPANEYNALHDNHATSYLAKPVVRKVLLKQKLINNKNEVICSQKEFNRYRSYLASIHNDELDSLIADADTRWMNERKQGMDVVKYQNQNLADGRDFQKALRVQKATKRNQMKQEDKARRYEEKTAADAMRECRYKQEKERQMINRKLMSMEKERAAAERRRKKLEQDMNRRKMLICQISMKDAAVRERVAAEKCILKRAYHQFLLEWLDSKYQFQADQKPKVEALQRAIEMFQREQSLKRQDRVERYREAMPDLIEKRKEKEAQVWEIVKRCFYRWLRKVRERKARKPDALHQSLWDAAMVLEDTLKYLRKESGYEKFDEFILNILKLKEEIKARLAEEEAEEERLRLLEEEEEEEEEETGAEAGSGAPESDQ